MTREYPVFENERSLRARIAAHALHSRVDSTELTRPAREASRRRLDEALLAEIDPNDEMPESERVRRLGHARKAHFARLALKSAQARRNRGGAR